MTTTTNLRTSRRLAAAKVLAAKATSARKVARVKAPAPATVAPVAHAVKAPEVAAIPVPKNAEALRHLIGVQKARRYRAGRRGDAALVALLEDRLELLGASVAAPKAEIAKVPVPAGRWRAPPPHRRAEGPALPRRPPRRRRPGGNADRADRLPREGRREEVSPARHRGPDGIPSGPCAAWTPEGIATYPDRHLRSPGSLWEARDGLPWRDLEGLV